MSEKPPWFQALQQFERAIGTPLEDYVKSDEFADRAAAAARDQAKLQRELAAGATQWLHEMNLPAASDIAELRDEIAALRKEVHDLREALVPAKPKPKPRRPRAKTTQSTARPKAK